MVLGFHRLTDYGCTDKDYCYNDLEGRSINMVFNDSYRVLCISDIYQHRYICSD